MSFSKEDQVFPRKMAAGIEAKIGEAIAKALREDYGEFSSAVKWIGRRTGAHPRAIRNWYEGRNIPRSGHLIMLARSSPNLLRVVLEQIGGEELSDAFQLLKLKTTKATTQPFLNATTDFYPADFIRINVAIDRNLGEKLNERQLWFLGRLQQHIRTRAMDIAFVWRVKERTARVDIAGLVEKDLVCFRGAKKTGGYHAFRGVRP